MYKTIGIMGGMGPAATVDLMYKIVEMTEADRDQDHIHIVVDNNTAIPDRTEALLSGGEDPVPEMLASAKCLEAAGADIMIVACNTAHCFIPSIADKTGMQILDMPVETALLLKSKGIARAAVLATDGTVKSGLYDRALREQGIEPVYPDEEQQRSVMSLVYDFIKKGKTEREQLPEEEIRDIVGDLRKRGAEALLLACTELPMAFEIMQINDDDCIDPTRVLAQAAIRESGAGIKAQYAY